MKNFFASPKFLTIAVAIIATVAIPLTIIQVQNQQNIQQRASESSYSTTQSASMVCGTDGFDINVQIKNTSASNIKVTAKDNQSGVSIELGVVEAGKTASGTINTKKFSMKAGEVSFAISKTDSNTVESTRSALYSVGNGGGAGYGYSSGTATCAPPASPTPELYSPTGSPSATPTVCPTLGPVKNVRIDCPNCPKTY